MLKNAKNCHNAKAIAHTKYSVCSHFSIVRCFLHGASLMCLYKRFFACFRLDVGLERHTITNISETSARGSLILWAKCQIPVSPRPCVGPRSGREGEKCRPQDHMTHVSFIHQLTLHTLLSINFNIYTKLLQIFCPCGVLKQCSFLIYACALSEWLISRVSAILKSFCPLCGKYYYEIQRDTGATQHCVKVVVAHSVVDHYIVGHSLF